LINTEVGPNPGEVGYEAASFDPALDAYCGGDTVFRLQPAGRDRIGMVENQREIAIYS